MPKYPAVSLTISDDLQSRLPRGTQIIAADGRVEMSNVGGTQWQQRYFFLEGFEDRNLFSYQTWGGRSVEIDLQNKQICGLPIEQFNGHACVIFYSFMPGNTGNFIPEIFAAYSRTNGEWMVENNPDAVSAMFRQSKAAPGLGALLFRQITRQQCKPYEGDNGVGLLREIIKELRQNMTKRRSGGSGPV